MNVEEILTLFRRETEDPTYDGSIPDSYSLWSNFQLIQYLNQAVNEFASKTYCLKDYTNFNLEVEADNQFIDLDNRILKVEHAELVSTNRVLKVITLEEFVTKYGPTWTTRIGTPQVLISDIEYDKLVLWPIPESDDTIKLTVRRIPLEDLDQMDDTPEIPSQYHYGLLHYMKFQAFSSPKAVLSGLMNLAGMERANWEEFLLRAIRDFKTKTRGPSVTRYGGI